MESLFRVFVLGKRFLLDSLLKVSSSVKVSRWIHSLGLSFSGRLTLSPQGLVERECRSTDSCKDGHRRNKVGISSGVDQREWL